MEKNKGITLVALVITVIILLILAGVALSLITGQEGLFSKARQAGTSYNEASQNELNEMNNLLAMINSVTDGTGGSSGGDNTESPFNSDKLEDIVGKGGAPATKEYTTEDNKKIVIPKEFGVKEDSPTNASEGIVVEYAGNEFVWVPVEDASSSMYEILETAITTSYGNKITKVGKLYNNGDKDNKIASYTVDSGHREPAILTSTDFGDASTTANRGIDLLKSIVGLSGDNTAVLKKFEENLINEFNEMIEKVEASKGFYVGRYETSLSGGKAQSKKNVESATAASDSANTWYGLYQKQKEFASSDNSIKDVVGSSMIWGSQYDQMMIWMPNDKVTTTIGDSRNTSRETGSVGTDVINNVYDLYGNRYEWTLEAIYSTIRVSRGGNFDDVNTPVNRNYSYNPYYTSDDHSSRLALYIK